MRVLSTFITVKLLQYINTWPAHNSLNKHNNACTAHSQNVLATLFYVDVKQHNYSSQNIRGHIRHVHSLCTQCVKMSS